IAVPGGMPLACDHPGCGGKGGGGGGGGGSGSGGGGLDPESARVAACVTAMCPGDNTTCQAQCVRDPNGRNWVRSADDSVQREWNAGVVRLQQDSGPAPTVSVPAGPSGAAASAAAGASEAARLTGPARGASPVGGVYVGAPTRTGPPVDPFAGFG